MKQIFQPGAVVTLRSVIENPGKTIIVSKSEGKTTRLCSGDASNWTAPMVVNKVATHKEDIKVNCFYYSSHMDSIVDKWFSSKSLKLEPISRQAFRPTTYKIGTVVMLKSALIHPVEFQAEHKFKLSGPTSTYTYKVTKTYGSSFLAPPIMNIVKQKESEGIMQAICMWHSRKTGRLYEKELPAHLVIQANKIYSLTTTPVPNSF